MILHISTPAIREQLERHPVSAGFHSLHLGWFPCADAHLVERPDGCNESILICCTSGKGWCEIDGQRRVLVGQGEAVWIPAGKPHRYGAVDDGPAWSIYWAHVAGTSVVAYTLLMPDERYVYTIPVSERDEIQKLFQKCLLVLTSKSELQALLFISHALRYVLGLVFLSETNASAPTSLETRRAIEESLHWMRRNLNRTLTLKEIATKAGLSPSRFSAVFRQAMSSSPVEYHIDLRMRTAAHLLDTSRLSIQQIARRMGYDDPYYFSRRFRKSIGVAPAVYRRSLKG